MATIVFNPNPTKKISVGGAIYKCIRCLRTFDDFNEARECAIADYTRDHGHPPVTKEV